MHFKKLFPSRYLRAVEFDDGELAVVIDRMDFEMVGQGNDAEEKPILYFSGMNQGLVLNVTNAETLADIHGDDSDNWPGKAITLFRTKVRFGKDRVDAIRVRPPAAPADNAVTPSSADTLDKEAEVLF